MDSTHRGKLLGLGPALDKHGVRSQHIIRQLVNGQGILGHLEPRVVLREGGVLATNLGNHGEKLTQMCFMRKESPGRSLWNNPSHPKTLWFPW